jgi:hypothetical protein
MSAKNRKLVDFYEEQGAEAGERPPGAGKTSSVNGEQMRRSEERMANTRDARDRGVSEVGAADQSRAEPRDAEDSRSRRREDG